MNDSIVPSPLVCQTRMEKENVSTVNIAINLILFSILDSTIVSGSRTGHTWFEKLWYYFLFLINDCLHSAHGLQWPGTKFHIH